MLCRIKLFSNVHRTEIVLVMGRELTMGVSSTKLDRQQQNFSGHILLSWSVVNTHRDRQLLTSHTIGVQLAKLKTKNVETNVCSLVIGHCVLLLRYSLRSVVYTKSHAFVPPATADFMS